MSRLSPAADVDLVAAKAERSVPATLPELRFLWYTDLYRYYGRASKWLLLKVLVAPWAPAGHKYTFLLRLCTYLRAARPATLFTPFYVLCRIGLLNYQYRYGLEIPPSVRIGPGLLIGHVGGIVIGEQVRIGKNCNLSHGVTIGVQVRGSRRGSPTIGDNVYIGPGAKIFGRISVGNDVAIGANAVVNRDVPDHTVVVGVPAMVTSNEGSAGYIQNADYCHDERATIPIR